MVFGAAVIADMIFWILLAGVVYILRS